MPTVLLALLIGAMAAVMLAARRPGHWWGDDWALYVSQAKGLLNGNAREVAEANIFTFERSSGTAFTPPVYPWGFPMLLALAIPFVGDGVDDLTIVGMLCACAFAVAWFTLARPRLGWAPALVGVPAVAMTPTLLGEAELVQSEWPFAAAALIGLVAIDRLRSQGRLGGPGSSWWPLVLLGAWAAYAFEIRREGLAMLPAILTAQVAGLWALHPPPGGWARWERLRAWWHWRLLLPYVGFAAAHLLVRATLTTVVVPDYPGNTVTNVWTRFDRNLDHVLAVAGLQREQLRGPTLFGSEAWGWTAAGTWLGLAVLGLALGCTVYLRRDAFLAAYAAAAFVVGATPQPSLNRYFVSVSPVLTLLAAVALAGVVRLPLRRFARVGVIAPAAVVALALAAITVANARDGWTRVHNAAAARRAGSIEWGSQHPEAQAMYAKVRELTTPDDVVGAPKARAMTLETGRWAIQVDDFGPIPPEVELAALVVNPTDDYDDQIAAEVADDPAWTEAWRGPRFIVYIPTEPPATPTE